MQSSQPSLRFRPARTAILLIAALAASSCDGLLDPEPELSPSDPSYNESRTDPGSGALTGISPAGPLAMLVGDTVRLELRLRTAGGDYDFVSFDSAVAHVTRDGLVTAVSSGQAVVAARAVGQQRPIADVTIDVGSRGAASIEITDLFDIAGSPADRAALSGRVEVGVKIVAGDATRADILIGSLIACSAEIPRTALELQDGATQDVTLRSDTDTAAFDEESGHPLFYNGRTTLGARLIGPRDRVLSTAAPLDVDLANPNSLAVLIEPEYEAVDSAGRRWGGGDLSISPFVVQYEPGPRPSTLRLEYAAPDGRDYSRTVDADAAHFVIRGEDLAGLVDEAFAFEATSFTSGGAAGPSGASDVLGYDGVPPSGSMRSREWIGAELAFARLFEPAVEPEPGIGILDVRFFAGKPGESQDQIVRSGTRVRVGADLRESIAGAYALAAEICDVLENCRTAGGADFGIDLTRPTLAANLPTRAINPGKDLHLVGADELSGFGEQPIEASVVALQPGMTQPMCGPVVDGVDLPGVFRNGACSAVEASEVIHVPRDTPGYYSYRATAVDRAGNRSSTVESTVLIDSSPPSVEGLRLPAGLVPGQVATVTATAADDLDLYDATFQLGYSNPAGGRLALPFAASVALGSPFSGRLTPTATVTGKIPFVRSITFATAAGQPRVTTLVDTLYADVRDAAGNSAQSRVGVPASSYGGDGSTQDPFPTIASAVASSNQQRICTSGCLPADSARVTVNVKVVGQSGFSPFSRTYLFGRTSDGKVQQLGSTGTFAVSDTGTQRTVTYTLGYAPPRGLTGALQLFAVGVSSGGDGLKTQDLAVEFYTR